MNINSNLASDVRRRAVISSSSSIALSGLSLGNILHGLTDTGSTPPKNTDEQSSLEARVFEALAKAKVWTSRVAMHLDQSARDRYFLQLDRLHDIEEWIGNEVPITLSSYKGFIRFMLLIKSGSKPALGLSARGNLVAVWEVEGNRLTIEFTADDAAEWVVSRKLGGTWERAAGKSIIARLPAVLSPYDPQAWLEQGL